jgi:hypothetical protein
MTVPQLSDMTKNKKTLSFILQYVLLCLCMDCSPTYLKWFADVNCMHLASLSKRWHVTHTLHYSLHLLYIIIYRVSQKKLTPLLFIWISNVSVFFDSPCIVTYIEIWHVTHVKPIVFKNIYIYIYKYLFLKTMGVTCVTCHISICFNTI